MACLYDPRDGNPRRGTQVASAQNYKSWDVTENAKDIDPDSPDQQTRIRFGQARAAVQSYMRSKTMDESGRDLINKFFREAYFRSWSRPANWTSAGKNRQEFLRNFYGPLNAKADTRQMVNQIALDFMREYIKPDYHPVLRYNAILLIGDLREQEMDNVNGKPEVPFAPATEVLLSAIEDPNQSDAVKVGAWVGLLDQCELYGVNLGSMSGDNKTKVLNLVIDTLKEKETPEGRSEAAHRWIRWRAIDVASAIGNAGSDGVLAAALDSIILDPELPIDMRCSAIAAKGNLAFDNQTAQKMDVVRQSTDIGKIALEAVAADINWFDDSMKQYMKKMRMGGGMGGMGGGYGGEYGGGYGGGYGDPMGYSPSPTPTTTARSSRSSRGRSRGRRGGSEYGGYEEMGPEMSTVPVEPPRDPLVVRMENTFRRRVKTHLDLAKQGLAGPITQMPDSVSEIQEGGLIRYAKSEDQSDIADLTKQMLAFLKTVDDEDEREAELLEASKEKLESLTGAAQKLADKASVDLEVPETSDETIEEALEDAPGAVMPRRGGAAPADVPGGAAPADVPGGAPADVPGGAPADVPGGAPADVPGGAPADVPGGPGPMPMGTQPMGAQPMGQPGGGPMPMGPMPGGPMPMGPIPDTP